MIICGTGHRPDKLGGYSDEVFHRLSDLARRWLIEKKDVTEVISGGALGWDQALAYAAIQCSIPMTLALPFEGFEKKWPASSQAFLRTLYGPDNVVYVCEPGYAAWKMQKRNEWMVDHADTVLALWDGSAGGTGNCVGYANKVGKPITNLWETYSGSSQQS